MGAEAFSYPKTSSELDTSSKSEEFSKPDALSDYVEDPEGVPVSMRSFSNWEAVTMPDTTLVGVPVVERVAGVMVRVPGGTYSRSFSSSYPMISRFNGTTDLERPRE